MPWARVTRYVSDPYDLSGVTNLAWTPVWPTAPSTSSTTNVETIGEWQTAVGQSNTRIIVSDASPTYTGNLTVTGNNLDIVVPNTVQLVGDVTMSGAYNVRWTGGNYNTDPADRDATWTTTETCHDLLFDDINWYGYWDCTSNSASSMARFALINSTLAGDAYNRADRHDGTFLWSFTNGRSADVIFANVKVDSASSGNWTWRHQFVDRLLIYQCALGMSLLRNGSTSDLPGLRFSQLVDYVHVEDCLLGNHVFGSLNNTPTTAYQQFGNAVFESIERYIHAGDSGLNGTPLSTRHSGNPANDGTVNNVTTYTLASEARHGSAYSLGADLVAGPDGNPAIQSYSALPDVSAYGAQR